MSSATIPFGKVEGFALLAVAIYTASAVFRYFQHLQARKAKGCGAIPTYPHVDPIWGLDVALGMAKALKNDYFLEWLNAMHRNMPKTFLVNFVGSWFIYTIEPENMKAMSAINWQDFAVGPMRRNNKAMHPFANKGVNTVDGEEWEFSRFLIKPFFMREAFTNTSRLGKHVDRMMNLFPSDGETFDIQPLIQRWFLDSSTESLFNESIESLLYPERADICWTMRDVLRGLRLRLQWYKYLFLFRHQSWLDAVEVVNNFLNKHIDTTSIFISHILWNLARQPKIYSKCVAEVEALDGSGLTFEKLRGMKYMNAVLNETHRLYPNGVTQVRKCIKNTTLPVGGGSDGKSPIYVRAGDVVQVNKNVIHRDPDLWGADVLEFRPERWEGLRPFWNFVPFGGGPRRCPAQMLVTVETTYVLARIMQRYKRFEARDSNPYVGVMRVGPSNESGVKIALFRK